MQFPLIPRGFLLIVAIRNDSNLTKISCGLRLAGDSLQPLHAPWTPAENFCRSDPYLAHQRMGVGSARRGHRNGHSVTYWMNRLQVLDDDKPLFVSIRSRS